MQIRKLHREKEPDFKTIKKLSIVKPKRILAGNGIPIYLLPIQDQEIVKIDIVFKAGDSVSDSALLPISTLSMLQEGSISQTSEEIAERLDFLGSYVYNQVSKDSAQISIYCLEKHLAETIKIVNDFILYPTIPEDKLQIHLLKRKEHYKIDIERVEIIAQKKFAQVLFGKNHPYGRSYQLEDFSHITREDIQEFHKQHYVANNCKIIVCGNLKSQTIKNLIDVLKHNELVTLDKYTQHPEYKIISDIQKQYHIEKENAVQSSLNIGKLMVNRCHPDFIPLQVLNTVFGGYFGSRLMSNIREDKGYTYNIGSGIISYEKTGCFIIASRVKKEECQNALDAIYHEMKRLRTERIPQKELDMVKTYILSTLVRNFDGAFATSEMLRNTFDYDLDFYKYYQNFWSIVSNIKPKELQDIANIYFNEDSMYEIVVG